MVFDFWRVSVSRYFSSKIRFPASMSSAVRFFHSLRTISVCSSLSGLAAISSAFSFLMPAICNHSENSLKSPVRLISRMEMIPPPTMARGATANKRLRFPSTPTKSPHSFSGSKPGMSCRAAAKICSTAVLVTSCMVSVVNSVVRIPPAPTSARMAAGVRASAMRLRTAVIPGARPISAATCTFSSKASGPADNTAACMAASGYMSGYRTNKRL